MALVLSDNDLTNIVNLVFEKVSSQTLSIEQLEITDNVTEIERASTLPVLIYPETEGEVDWYDEGVLKRIKVKTWVDIIDKMRDDASGSLEIIKIIRDQADLILNTPGILDSVHTLEEAKAALNGAIKTLTELQGSTEISLIGGETARFSEFNEEDTIVPEAEAFDMTDYSGSYKIVYSVKSKLFYLNIEDKYYDMWSNGPVDYDLYQYDYKVDDATIVKQIYKNKVYICGSSLYVWDLNADTPEEERNLVEISGSGSGGAGNGAFNVNTNENLIKAYDKNLTTVNPAEVKSLEDAIKLISDVVVTADFLKYSKSDFALLKGMTITYFDPEIGKYVNWTNTLTSDSNIAEFDVLANWYRTDNLNSIETIRINYGGESAIELKNKISEITQKDIEKILSKNTLSKVTTIDGQEGKEYYEANRNMPINSDAVTQEFTDRLGEGFNKTSIPNSLTATPSSDGTYTNLTLTYTDPNTNETTPIGNTVQIKGGGGSGSESGSDVSSFNAYLYESDPDVNNKLTDKNEELKLQFYMDLTSIVDNQGDNFKINKITVKKGSYNQLAIPFMLGDNIILPNTTGTIEDEALIEQTIKSDLGTSSDNALTLNIPALETKDSATFYVSITYTYLAVTTNAEGETKEEFKQRTINAPFKLTVASVSIEMQGINNKMITSASTFATSFRVNSSLPNAKIKYYLNQEADPITITETASNGATVAALISGLHEGVNKIFVYCYINSGTQIINGNGIYFEIYCTGINASYTETAPIVTGLNYPNYITYLEDDRVPCLYIKQYDQNTGFFVESYHNTQNEVPTLITVYDDGNETIAESITTSIASLAYTGTLDINAYYKYTSFFRNTTPHGTFRKISITIGNVTRSFNLFVTNGDFKIDLPSNKNLVFDFRAKGKTNNDTSKNVWTSNQNSTYYFDAKFENIKFTSTCGWTGDSLLLGGDANVTFGYSDGTPSINLDSIALNGGNKGMTFCLKYATSKTSDDNYEFFHIIDTEDKTLLSITPSKISVGTNYLQVAPDTTVDLVITSSYVSGGFILSMIYLNGVMSNISKELFFKSASSAQQFAAIKEIKIGSCDGKTMPLNINLYNISLYNSFISENMSLGVRAVNESSSANIDDIVNRNQMFDLLTEDNGIEFYEASNFRDQYGDRQSDHKPFNAWLKTYTDSDIENGVNKEDPRINFLLDDQDLANIPAGLRVVIVQGPYCNPNFNKITGDNQNGNGVVADISDYVETMNANKPINNDVIDSLCAMAPENKSLRIAGTALWTYIKKKDDNYTESDPNYCIARPVFSDQGTSAMNYNIRNLRVYTQKKTKAAYTQNPWPIKDKDNIESFVGNSYAEEGKANGYYQDFTKDNEKNVFGETSILSNGSDNRRYLGLPASIIGKTLGELNYVQEGDVFKYEESGDNKVWVDTIITEGNKKVFWYYKTLPTAKYTFELKAAYTAETWNTTDYITVTPSNGTTKVTLNGTTTIYSGKDDAALVALANKYGFAGYNSTADFMKYSFNTQGKCLNSESEDTVLEIAAKTNIKINGGTVSNASPIVSQGKTYYNMFDYMNNCIVYVTGNTSEIKIYPQLVKSGYFRWNRLETKISNDYYAFQSETEPLQVDVPATYITSWETLSAGMAADGIRRDDNCYLGDGKLINTPKKFKTLGSEFGQAVLKPLSTFKFVPGDPNKGIVADGKLTGSSGAAKGTIKMRNTSFPSSNFCIKVDYAESSGTQNTGGARFTNDIFNEIVKTPVQEIDKNGGIRTSIDGQAGILISYSPTGWFGQTAKKYLFRGKINWNDEKSQQELFGFEGNAQYMAKPGYPNKLSDYAKNRLLNYFYGELHSGTHTWDDNTTDDVQKKVQEIIKNTVDVGATQCWEFSTGSNVSFWLDRQLNSISDYFKDKDDYVIYNEDGTNRYIKTTYTWEGNNNTNGVWTDFSFKFNNGDGTWQSTESDCLGNFIPIWENYSTEGVVNPDGVSVPGKLIGKNGKLVSETSAAGKPIDFGTLVWAAVEGEAEIEQKIESIRPLWGIQWEARYPDYGFTLTDWHTSYGSTLQKDPGMAASECEYFMLNPIYLETVYSWLASFKGHENEPAEQRRFIQQAPYFFNVKNLCMYYSLSEVMLACDQRLKNQMFAFYWVSQNTAELDQDDYNNDQPWKEEDTGEKDVNGNPIYKYTGSVTKPYGCMEGRRIYVIFYDCDTTYGIANTGFLEYSWNEGFYDHQIRNYGYNSVLWNMVKNCFSEYKGVQYSYFDYDKQNVANNTYYFDIRIAYDKIRQFCYDGSFTPLDRNGYDVNIQAGNGKPVGYTKLLNYYNADNAQLYNEQIYNKDAIYKYYKVETAYAMCQGNRIEHKKWWVDNRLKWLDAKYSTGIINSLKCRFYGAGSIKTTISGKTSMETSTFYYTGAKQLSEVYTFNDKDFVTGEYNVTIAQENENYIYGWYWFDSLIFTFNETSNVYTGGGCAMLGSQETLIKYLKTLKLDKYDLIFRSKGLDNIYYQGDINSNSYYYFLQFNYIPSLQNLYLYNEPPRNKVDLQNCSNISYLDIFNSYVNTILLPSGSYINGSNLLLTRPTQMTVQLPDGSPLSGNAKKYVLVAPNASQFKFLDTKFYDSTTTGAATATNKIDPLTPNVTTIMGMGSQWPSFVMDTFRGLYLVGCGGDELYNTNLMKALIDISNPQVQSDLCISIDKINLTGNMDVLNDYLVLTQDGRPATDSSGNYIPRFGSVGAGGAIDNTKSGIQGVLTLNVYPTDEVLNKYSKVFEHITFKTPDFSYVRIDNFEIKNGNANYIQSGARVTNFSNQTGYMYRNMQGNALYQPDGHLKRILDRRHRVLAKTMENGVDENGLQKWILGICKLDDNDSTKYAEDSSLEANLKGPEGDVFVLEPHFWYKGVNDWETGQQYLFCSSTEDTSSLTKESDMPQITSIRYAKPLGNNLSMFNEGSARRISETFININKVKENTNVEIKTFLDKSTKGFVVDIRLAEIFTKDEILNSTYLAVPSWLQRNYGCVLGLINEETVNNQSLATKIQVLKTKNHIFNKISNASWDAQTQNSKYQNYGNDNELICTDNLNVIELPTGANAITEANWSYVHVLINVSNIYRASSTSQSIYNNKANVTTNDKQYAMILDDIILFKPQLSSFPWLDVYPWIEHKACLGGVYHAQMADNTKISSDLTKGSTGLTSTSGIGQARVNVRSKMSMNQLNQAIYYKNNFTSKGIVNGSSTADVNPGYQLFDYEMQRNIQLMSIFKYGNLHDKYIYGYNKEYYYFIDDRNYHDLSKQVIPTGGINQMVDKVGMKDTNSYAYIKYREDVKTKSNVPDNSDLTKEDILDYTNSSNEYNIHMYEPYQNNASYIFEENNGLDDLRLPYDNCLGYQNLVSTLPTTFEPNTYALGSVIAIYNPDGFENGVNYRIINTQSVRENVSFWRPEGQKERILEVVGRYSTPYILSFGKYCDIFNAFTLSLDNEGILDAYGSYTSQGAQCSQGTSEQPYILCMDRCNQDTNKMNMLEGYDQGYYQYYNGAFWDDYDYKNVGISSIAVEQYKPTEQNQRSTRLAYRGSMIECSYNTFINLKWEMQNNL